MDGIAIGIDSQLYPPKTKTKNNRQQLRTGFFDNWSGDTA